MELQTPLQVLAFLQVVTSSLDVPKTWAGLERPVAAVPLNAFAREHY